MYFSDPVIFEIPVRPRVRKFVQAKLVDENGVRQPMLVSPDCEGIGLHLWAMAQSKKEMLQTGWRRSKAQNAELSTDKSGRILAPEDMTERLGLGIFEFHYSRHQYLLNYCELEVFSSFVDHLIMNEMVTYCQASPGVEPMIRIKAYCDLYDFAPDDVSELMLKTVYYRSRKRTGASHYDVRVTRVQHFVPVSYYAAA
jgi:hypothetical protein